MAKVPGFQRALTFYRLNLRFEGNREWNWTIRDYDDKQLLAAAEFARKSEIYDRAINTADRTRELHDFSMRYLAPYRDVMKSYVSQQQLDEAWVYGLIRQESRFIADVKSSAGAIGLMQLMPATARWVAQKVGLKDYRGGTQTANVETNLNLGTWYLRHVLDTLDSHPVLASAAYNAGPGRARAWRAERTDGSGDLCRIDSVQRNARLREESHEQRQLLRPAVRADAAVAQGAHRRDRAAFAHDGKTAGRTRRLRLSRTRRRHQGAAGKLWN